MRAVIGLTGQFSAVDALFTGEENLRLMADLRHLGKEEGRRRVGELLERFDLVDAARQQVSTYSGGMRRRLDLAMTLVGDPRIIFLDEPTAGLDPRSRRTMWDIIRDLVGGGVTVLLTTQYLEEADRLADRIAFLDHGRIVADGTPAELKRLAPGGHVRVEFADPARLDRAAASSMARSATRTRLPCGSRATAGWPRCERPRSARRSVDRSRRAVREHARPRRRLPVAHRSAGCPQRSRLMNAIRPTS